MDTAFTDPPGRSLKILIADDNLLNQTVMVQMLKHLGHLADTVSTGLDVLEALRQHPYDVVFLDLQMPHVDGLTIAQQVSQDWATEQRPCVIGVTQQAPTGEQRAGAAVGIEQWLVKPLRLEDLSQVLQQCQSQRADSGSEESLHSPALSPLDAEVLAEIWHMAGDDAPSFILTAVDTYVDEAHVMLQTLQEAIAQHHVDVIQQTAHSFKTMSGFWGANELSDLCKTLEVMGKAAIVPSPAVMQQLAAEYERVEAALMAERQKAWASLHSGRSQT